MAATLVSRLSAGEAPVHHHSALSPSAKPTRVSLGREMSPHQVTKS